jgi:hypothetical protein
VRVPIGSLGGDGTSLLRCCTRPLSRGIISSTGSRPPVGPAATTKTRTPTRARTLQRSDLGYDKASALALASRCGQLPNEAQGRRFRSDPIRSSAGTRFAGSRSQPCHVGHLRITPFLVVERFKRSGNHRLVEQPSTNRACPGLLAAMRHFSLALVCVLENTHGSLHRCPTMNGAYYCDEADALTCSSEGRTQGLERSSRSSDPTTSHLLGWAAGEGPAGGAAKTPLSDNPRSPPRRRRRRRRPRPRTRERSSSSSSSSYERHGLMSVDGQASRPRLRLRPRRRPSLFGSLVSVPSRPVRSALPDRTGPDRTGPEHPPRLRSWGLCGQGCRRRTSIERHSPA